MKPLTHRIVLGSLTLPLFIAGCGDKKADEKKRDKDAEEEEERKPRFTRKELDEARNTIGAITRGAVGAFEREQVAADGKSFEHVLCKSATSVPAKLPEKSEKVTVPESDWGGDGETGWKCLKFISTRPVLFQYSYIAGGPYKGKGRVTDPGPDGFQVCAEADLEPGGETTLICRMGKINKATNAVMVGTELEEHHEQSKR